AVLMVTAYGQDAMLQASQGMDLQGVLLKPVTQSAMFNTLVSAMSGRAVQAALPTHSAYQPLDLRAFAALRGQRVLVADDNALNREVATDFLLHVGVQVYTAVDGQDAIRCLQAQQMDAVLMDIHMPIMDGLAATREIRSHARWKDLPIIALTAQARGEDVQLSLDAGMNGHLSKPIDEALLYRTLMEHCCPSEAALAQTLLPSSSCPVEPSPQGFARLSSSPTRQAQLLRGFLKDFGDLPQRFEQMLGQSQWTDIGAWAHQIKGSASYLDATALCRVADTIELAAQAHNEQMVVQHAGEFVAQVQTCLDHVHAALQALENQEGPAAAHAARRWQCSEVLAQLAQLRPLLANRDFAAQRLLEDLVQGSADQPWADNALAALQAFDDLEVEQALASLDALEQQCYQGHQGD
ncbi:MAG: response regulator, partial [Comamonas sp.]|nr:response regulator [Candidatus Comamonas equi]